MADEREPSLSEIYAAVCEMSDRLPLELAMRQFEERDGVLIYRPRLPRRIAKAGEPDG
jgi:hypothetical protein